MADATLPPGADACDGIPRPRFDTPVDICRGCRRWLARGETVRRLAKRSTTRNATGTWWCRQRIGA